MTKVDGIQNTHFETNYQNFDSGLKPNEVLILGKNLKLLIVTKNHFQQYIICLCLESVAQITFFEIISKLSI